MRIGLSLKPGQGGTKRLLAQYSERLICVRYRYDEKRNKRLKTVELVIEESDWRPQRRAIGPDEIIGVRVEVKETDLQSSVRKAGGRWNSRRKLWEMRYERAVKLGLKSRITRLKPL